MGRFDFVQNQENARPRGDVMRIRVVLCLSVGLVVLTAGGMFVWCCWQDRPQEMPTGGCEPVDAMRQSVSQASTASSVTNNETAETGWVPRLHGPANPRFGNEHTGVRRVINAPFADGGTNSRLQRMGGESVAVSHLPSGPRDGQNVTDSGKTLDELLADVRSGDPDIREHALGEIKQLDPAIAVPKLAALAETTEDAQIKVAIQDAISFLELPSAVLESCKGATSRVNPSRSLFRKKTKSAPPG